MFTPLVPEEALLRSQRVPWDSRDPISSHWRKGGDRARLEGKASFQHGAGRPAILHGENKTKKIIF